MEGSLSREERSASSRDSGAGDGNGGDVGAGGGGGAVSSSRCHRTRMDKVCVCVDYVCGATATAIDRLVGDKVGWPRRGVERAVGGSG